MRKLFTTAAALLAMTQGAAAAQIWLTMDQVRPFKLEKAAQSIVVGNPAIADVTVRDTNNLLLFGKAPGLTNIYFFDENGDPVENLIVRVRTPSADMLTVQRGVARSTYNCTTNCEPTITVGDDQKTFDDVSAQVKNKYTQAQGAAKEGN